MDCRAFEIVKLPSSGISRDEFIEAMGADAFAIINTISEKRTVLLLESEDPEFRIRMLSNSSNGIRFKEARFDTPEKLQLYSIYRKAGRQESSLFEDVFDLGLDSGMFGMAFLPQDERSVERLKAQIESALSNRGVRESRQSGRGAFGLGGGISSQFEIFYGSGDGAMLQDLLYSINESILKNGVAYKVVIFTGDDNLRMQQYLCSKFVVLESRTCYSNSSANIFDLCRRFNSLTFGAAHARQLLSFPNARAISYVVKTAGYVSSGDIAVGTIMKNGVFDTGEEMKLELSTLNLGCIISGLPGSGKTMETMNIMHQIASLGEVSGESTEAHVRPLIAIIAPTDEWDAFASGRGMNVIRICADGVPINFFSCPKGVEAEFFYHNLALILASAVKAGPYKEPLEKCLINAFRKIYSDTKNPHPVDVYRAIMDSVIAMHGKRTNVGVKYTKHGENIKSSLETLIEILNRPEYSVEDGVQIDGLLDDGIVFDLSNASGNSRGYYYAAILNQLYMAAEAFDNRGEKSLRMIICLEEAQLIFGEKNSAAVEDLIYKIQDFRKKGIGLVLLAHNAMDIDPRIRRLCQTKLYFKQAPDIAALASKDLIFTYSDEDSVVSKLKHLDERVCALTYISRDESGKQSHDTMFVRTHDFRGYENGAKNAGESCLRRIEPKTEDCLISVVFPDPKTRELPVEKICFAKILYLDDVVCSEEARPEDNGIRVRAELMAGRKYRIELLDSRLKLVWESDFFADLEVSIHA